MPRNTLLTYGPVPFVPLQTQISRSAIADPIRSVSPLLRLVPPSACLPPAQIFTNCTFHCDLGDEMNIASRIAFIGLCLSVSVALAQLGPAPSSPPPRSVNPAGTPSTGNSSSASSRSISSSSSSSPSLIRSQSSLSSALSSSRSSRLSSSSSSSLSSTSSSISSRANTSAEGIL